jgi:hypothetical protein
VASTVFGILVEVILFRLYSDEEKSWNNELVNFDVFHNVSKLNCGYFLVSNSIALQGILQCSIWCTYINTHYLIPIDINFKKFILIRIREQTGRYHVKTRI